MTTITIEVEDDLLARARELAAARSVTVSEMLHRLLRVAVQHPLHESELPPFTRRAMGMLQPMSNDQVKESLDEHRTRKYGA